MNQLNICSDIDGTVTRSDDWLDLINKSFDKSIASENHKIYDYHRLIGILRENYEAFYQKHKKEMFAKSSFRPMAKEVISEFYQNHRVHFVTAWDTDVEPVTIQWLMENFVDYDSISHLGSHNKVQRAFELDCDLFIEDRYENAWELSEAGFEVLLMNCPYNQGPIHYRTTRICHWNDILEIVREKEVKNTASYARVI